MTIQNATDKPKNGRKPNERPTLMPETALEVVKTSLDYAKGAGLPVKIGNRGGLCVITIGGAFWNDDTQSLCVTPDDDTQAHDTQSTTPETAGRTVTHATA
ncbi:hypothetical protein TFLX_02779 [Thermoflexales bacterium]|nr:hypothetical protein TFLX_02779 [Thermoflexales bacterium]